MEAEGYRPRPPGLDRAPQWTHGGIAFGPKPRSYRYAIPKKMRRLALKSALSDKVATGDMIVLDALTLEEIKTKTVAAMLKALGADKKAMIVLPEKNETVLKSARNIPGVNVTLVNTLNTYEVLNADKFIVLKDAVTKIEEVYK